MTTLSVAIAEGADDAGEVIATGAVTVNGNATSIRDTVKQGFRFLVPDVPQGVTINSAHIQFTSAGTHSSTPLTVSIACQAANAGAAFTTATNDISSRSLTTATVSWVIDEDVWTLGDRTAVQLTPDLKTAVQEVVNRAGFDGVLVFIMQGDSVNLRSPAMFENTLHQEAVLTLDYGEAAEEPLPPVSSPQTPLNTAEIGKYTHYWAAREALIDVVDHVESRLASLEAASDGAGGEDGAIQTQIDAIDVRVDDLETAVAALASPQLLYVSVKQFGALGNGNSSEDDTQAFQDAIDTVRTATQTQSGNLVSGVVFVPPGSYYISNIKLRTGVCLMGASTHSAILVHLAAHTGSMITLNTNDVNHAEVRNLTLSGGGREGIGIDFVNSDDDGVINAATIFDIGDPQNRISNVLVTNFNGGSASTGIKINSRAMQMSNFHITHCDFGLDVDSSDGKYYMGDVNWIGKKAVQVGGGNNELVGVKAWYVGIDATYAFGDAFTVTSGRNKLIGCEAQDVSRHGLVIDSGDNIIVEGLMLDNIGNFFLHQSQGIDHPTSTQKVAISLEGASPTYNKVSFTLAQRSASPDLQGVVSMTSGALNNHVEAMVNAAHLDADAPKIHFTGATAGTNVVEINGIRQGLVVADIAASADDGTEVIAGGANSITGTSTTVDNTRINGWRFLVPTLPQAATILDARLQWTPAASHSGATDILITGEDADAGAQFGTVASDISGRLAATPTTATVTWSSVPAWTSSTRDYHALSPNLATIVQEIVDRAGFDGVLVFFTEGQSANPRSPATEDNASLAAPTLYVVYEL